MKRLLLSLVLLLPGLGLAGETAYVQSDAARIMAQPGFNSSVVATLTKGAGVSVLEKQGDWYKIAAGSHSGWVARLVLSSQPPMNKITVLGGEDETLQKEARRRASASITAGATRGLTEEDRARVHQDQAADYDAVKKMEDTIVNDAEVKTFIEQGGNKK